MLGFGGAPSAIPLVHQEVVKKYKWMEDDEFSDVVALANTMPGFNWYKNGWLYRI